jgi:hypothetical protein
MKTMFVLPPSGVKVASMFQAPRIRGPLIALLVLAMPAPAGAQETLPAFPPFLPDPHPAAAPDFQATDGLPAGDQPLPVTTTCYWTVSSRGLPQQPTQCASHRLGYYERLGTGTLRPTSREAMIAQLSPGVPICIFIHGSFVDAASHRSESAHTYNWIRRGAPNLPAHFLFYTWPSEAMCNAVASANPAAVNDRGRWAEHNAFYLADLIAHLPHDSPICLVGHSHGARVTLATLHLIAGGSIDGRTYSQDTGHNRRYRAVLAAGAVDRHWLNPGQHYDFAIRRVEGILNMVNATDAALHFYPLRQVFSRKAIAVTGLTRWDRHRLGEQGNKLIDYDVTTLVGLGHFWPNYYEESQIGRAISPYVYFTDSNLIPTYNLTAVPLER